MEPKISKWGILANFVSEKFNIPKRIFDLASSDMLLSKCAEGISNRSLNIAFGYDIEYLEYLFNKHYGFIGWPVDLDINPLLVYNIDMDILSFRQKISEVRPVIDDDTIQIAFKVCKIYTEIRKELDKYYDN